MDPALRSALGALLPSALETDLLGACLLDPGGAGAAWSRFLKVEPDPARLFRADTGRRKRLAPLLMHGLSRCGSNPHGHLGTVLKTAALRESLRAEAYYGICRDLTETLADAGVPFVVVGGAALGLTAYSDPALRHSHEVDLLVQPDELSRAETALTAAGLTRRPSDETRRWLTLRHRSGMPVRLRTSLYPSEVYRCDWPDLTRRAARTRIGRRLVPVPSVADSLIQACAEASFRPRQASLLWAADLVMLSGRLSSADWNAVVELATESRTQLPARILLGYAAEHLAAPVPVTALRGLDVAWDGDPELRDVALHGARKGPGGGAADLLSRVDAVRDRIRLATWLAFPSREFVAGSDGDLGEPPTASWYGRRLVRGAARRLGVASAG